MQYYSIVCSQSKWLRNTEKEAATGIARFTAADMDDETNKGAHSVEVAVTFDPVTKTWSATVVKQWEGRF